jgi:hypothetical protein
MKSEATAQVVSRALIKSKQRMADHGEVFTPPWLVEAMLDLTGESDRIDARFLEPACGNGNFLIRILQRKIAIVELKSRKRGYDKRNYALIALMSVYGIELLRDNISECRRRMLETFADYLKIGRSDDIYRAASNVLTRNLIHGDALKMCTADNRPIIFSEWEYLGKGRFGRRDFRFDLMAQASAIKSKSAAPIKTYPMMTIREIAL